MQPWYLDIMAPDQWDVVLHFDKEEQLDGIHTFCIQKKWNSTLILPIPLIPYSGIWYKYPSGGTLKANTQLSFRHDMMVSLMDQLPVASIAIQNLRPMQTDILPLMWKKWKHQVRFTFYLDTRAGKEQLLANIKSSLRNEIRSAEKKLYIKFNEDLPSAVGLFQQKLRDKRAYFSHSDEKLLKLVQNCIERNQGTIINTYQANTDLVASTFFVWDSEQVYYMLSGNSDAKMEKGANALLIWQGIQLAADKSLGFNFEGGMSKGIGQYFAGFGAQTQPYLQINRCVNQFWSFIGQLRFGL
ncbi:MAG: hypothetical protein ABIV51_06690 [Saprospiraceae bacterium]